MGTIHPFDYPSYKRSMQTMRDNAAAIAHVMPSEVDIEETRSLAHVTIAILGDVSTVVADRVREYATLSLPRAVTVYVDVRAKAPSGHRASVWPIVRCPDCGTAWPVSHAPTTCDGDACVTRRARARREAQRREIDAVLREDARRFPAFATARKCAVMAAVETNPHSAFVVGAVGESLRETLGWLREYENLRGALTKPTAPAINHARATFGEDALASYERARRST